MAIQESEFGMEDLISAASGVLTFGKGVLTLGQVLKAIGDKIKGPDQKLDEYVQAEAAKAVVSHIPEIQRRVKHIEEKTSANFAVASDIANVFRAYSRAWQHTADGKKRRVIVAAFVNAFDL